MNIIKLVSASCLLCSGVLAFANTLPISISDCVKAVKTGLATYKRGDELFSEKSKFLTSEFAKTPEMSDGKIKSPDGAFVLELQEKLECGGDTAHYQVNYRDQAGNVRNVNDPASSCGDNLVEVSPNSKYILLSGLRILKLYSWEICPLLLGEVAYYPVVEGWSEDGKKILIREYDIWEGASMLKEYLIEIIDE